MDIEFPCSVHKENYETSLVARDAEELAELKANGWLTSKEWHGLPPPVKHRGTGKKTETDSKGMEG